jgi:hypothetical protein
MLSNGYTAPFLPHLPADGYGLSAPSSIELMAPLNWTHIFLLPPQRHHDVYIMDMVLASESIDITFRVPPLTQTR